MYMAILYRLCIIISWCDIPSSYLKFSQSIILLSISRNSLERSSTITKIPKTKQKHYCIDRHRYLYFYNEDITEDIENKPHLLLCSQTYSCYWFPCCLPMCECTKTYVNIKAIALLRRYISYPYINNHLLVVYK